MDNKESRYFVVKSLNHSGVLAKTELGEEVILLGKGIGFGVQQDQELTNIANNVKCYHLASGDDSLHEIVNDTDPVFLEIASDIITEAKKQFKNFDDNILVFLADHIAFSIERMKNGEHITNPLLEDIRLLFKEEFKVAKNARNIIEEKLGVIIDDDEIGYISLHIHSGLSNNKPAKALQYAQIVHELQAIIEDAFGIDIDVDSMSYMRLLNHIKFLVIRMDTDEKILVSVNEYAKKEFPESYAISCKICEYISNLERVELTSEEVGYLTLHIEKVRAFHFQNNNRT